MKKFLSGLIAALLLSAGLVASSGVGAQAAPSAKACGGQYQPVCVKTKTTAKPSNVSAKQKPKVTVSVKANGNVKPTGTVTVTVNGKTYTGTLKGGKVVVKLPKLKPGKYTVTVKYEPAADSNYSPSTTKTKIVVRKK